MKIPKEIVTAILKRIDRRIAKLKKRLELAKRDRAYYSFDDCADSYNDSVSNTKAVIEELVTLRKSFEEWDWIE